MTVEGIVSASMMPADEVLPVLKTLEKENLIRRFRFQEEDFFQAIE